MNKPAILVGEGKHVFREINIKHKMLLVEQATNGMSRNEAWRACRSPPTSLPPTIFLRFFGDGHCSKALGIGIDVRGEKVGGFLKNRLAMPYVEDKGHLDQKEYWNDML